MEHFLETEAGLLVAIPFLILALIYNYKVTRPSKEDISRIKDIAERLDKKIK